MTRLAGSSEIIHYSFSAHIKICQQVRAAQKATQQDVVGAKVLLKTLLGWIQTAELLPRTR